MLVHQYGTNKFKLGAKLGCTFCKYFKKYQQFTLNLAIKTQ